MGLICLCQTSAYVQFWHIATYNSSGFRALPQCQRHCLDCNMARQTHGAYMFNGVKHMLECTRNLCVVGEMNIAPCTVKGLWSVIDKKQSYPRVREYL